MVGLAIVFRLLAGAMDADRVRQNVQDNGWELIDARWDPFGPGWFGEKDSRIYRITYRDQKGRLHEAHAKTSMLSGVYLTNDRTVEQAAPLEEPQNLSLREENQLLRRRIEELERGSDS